MTTKMRPLWSKEPCTCCGEEGYASRSQDVPASNGYLCEVCEAWDRADKRYREELEKLQKQLEQVTIHCEIREKALYKIRELVNYEGEVSKVAGEALCYGNYTRKMKNSNHLYIVETCPEDSNSWSLQLDLIYDWPNSEISNQVEQSNPGLKFRWAGFQRIHVPDTEDIKGS
jgi:hypothetical protein